MTDEENTELTHAVQQAHWLMVNLWQQDPVKLAITRAYDWRVSLRTWEIDVSQMARDRWKFVQLYTKLLAD